MTEAELPLFLLDTVLFPDGRLPLRVFEPRYLDMLCRCMRNDSQFGVVLIRNGQEVGRAATPYSAGTSATVLDWDQGRDGVLEIVAQGTDRFRILDCRVGDNQLTLARVETIPGKPGVPVPFRLQTLSLGLGRILTHHLRQESNSSHSRPPPPLLLDDAEWVGLRLAQVLPMPLTFKQVLLELESPLERLERISAWIAAREKE